MEITLKLAQRVLKNVDRGLVRGLGRQLPGKMCVEAAICSAMGLAHGDNPPGVAPSLRALKIRLNDSNWSTPRARAKGLRKLALLQLGTADVLDEITFAQRLVPLANAAAAVAANASAAVAVAAVAAVVAVVAYEASDAILQKFADDVAEILIDMQVPGVQWLSLL